MGRIANWIRGLNTQERWFGGIAAFSFALYFGTIVCVLTSPGVDWGVVGSIAAPLIALVAFCVAVPTYLDNRKAQQLEHRAYLSLTIPQASVFEDGEIIFTMVVTNFGRTPAMEVQCKYSASADAKGIGDSTRIGEYYEIRGDFAVRDVNPPHPETEVIESKMRLRQEDAADIVNYKLILHFEIDVTFQDVFGAHHSVSKTFDFCGPRSWGETLYVFYLDAP